MFETTWNLHLLWIKVEEECPEIAAKALESLLPFLIPHLCEAGFSAVTAMKMRWWSRLDISITLQVSLSPISPRWDHLVAGKQAQGSHWFILWWVVWSFHDVSQCNNRNSVHSKCTWFILKPTPSPPIRGKIVLHETSPWCLKGYTRSFNKYSVCFVKKKRSL